MAYFNIATDGIYLVASFWKNMLTAFPDVYENGEAGYQTPAWRWSIFGM